MCGCISCRCLGLVNEAEDVNNTELLSHGASASALHLREELGEGGDARDAQSLHPPSLPPASLPLGVKQL